MPEGKQIFRIGRPPSRIDASLQQRRTQTFKKWSPHWPKTPRVVWSISLLLLIAIYVYYSKRRKLWSPCSQCLNTGICFDPHHVQSFTHTVVSMCGWMLDDLKACECVCLDWFVANGFPLLSGHSIPCHFVLVHTPVTWKTCLIQI